jgi:hypothetical protein
MQVKVVIVTSENSMMANVTWAPVSKVNDGERHVGARV